ncbi:MAG: enoyl-CoA hydratase-related protein [Hyphomonadaceae bacterium]
MSAFETILYEEDEGVGTITLNRPGKLNAWTPAMEREVKAAVMSAGADSAVRAIVITGAGKAFCAGADVSNLEAVLAGDESLLPERVTSTDPFDQRYTYLLATPKPVIAAVNGTAAGVGLALTLFCDLRFVSARGSFAPVFARRGLIAEHGVAWMLPRLIGPMAAMTALMSGRTIGAEESVSLGLAQQLPYEDFVACARAAARDLVAASSPRSIAVIKRQVYRGLMQDLGAAVAEATDEQILCLRSADFAEGVAHFRERRAPRFTGG